MKPAGYSWAWRQEFRREFKRLYRERLDKALGGAIERGWTDAIELIERMLAVKA